MKNNPPLLAAVVLLSVFIQDSLIARLAIFRIEGDLVFALLITIVFFTSANTALIIAFSTGLLRGFMSLAVTNSLGFYPLIYLTIISVIIRFTSNRSCCSSFQRGVIFLLALLAKGILQSLLWLLLIPNWRPSYQLILVGLGNALYTVVIWLFLAFFFFRRQQDRSNK